MSSEKPEISISEAISHIQHLLDTKQGDAGRLRYISEKLKRGRKLYHSDQIYLTRKLNARIVPKKPKKITINEGQVRVVQFLINNKLGDPGRLKFIFKSLQKNKSLYKTDEKYLETKSKLIKKHLESKSPARVIPKMIEPSQERSVIEVTDRLKTELNKANQEISHLNEIISSQTLEIKKLREGYLQIPSEIPEEDFEVKEFPEKVEEIKKIVELQKTYDTLTLRRSKLTQLIVYRQEYERKVNREKILLDEEIKIEEQKIREKDQLVEELIKKQSELTQTKAEREVLLEQIKLEKSKLDNDLREQKEELERLKIEYEDLEKTIKKEKEDLQNQIEDQKKKNNHRKNENLKDSKNKDD